jgi:DNA mismatch endonuclease, patch repair protein
MDFLTKRQRSSLMSKVRGKNTRIEIVLFGLLKGQKLGFRRHFKGLPGSPDVVLRDCKIAIFVDGDFWHGRNYLRWRNKLTEVWKRKIEANIRRDKRIDGKLRSHGWSVLHIWGKDLVKTPQKCIKRILSARIRKMGNMAAS